MTPKSPLPWKVEDGPKGVLIITAEGKPYLGTLRYSDNPNLGEAEARANADYLEKAANFYPVLVAALKKAKAGCRKPMGHGDGLCGQGYSCYECQDIEKALKAAGEL